MKNIILIIFANLIYFVQLSASPNFQVMRPGFEHRSKASLGLISDPSTAANFTNPASVELKQQGFSAHVDASFFYLQHTYKHPDFERFKLSVFAPSILFGAGYKTDWLDLSISVFPTGLGTESVIEGLPVDIASDLAAKSKIVGSQLGVESSLGMGLNLTPQIRLGFSAVHTFQNTKLNIKLTGVMEEAEYDNFLEADFKGSFVRFIAGGVYHNSHFGIGLAVEFPKEMKFEGDSTTYTGIQSQKNAVATADYQPWTLGLGVRGKFNHSTVGLEYKFAAHKKGRDVVKNGFNENDSQASNLLDSHSLGIHGEFPLSEKTHFFTGVSYVQKMLGPTVYAGQGGPDNLGLTGLKFGDFAALDRFQFGVGFSYLAAEAHHVRFGIDLAYGESDVGDEFRGKGTYHLFMSTLNGAYSWKF